MAPIFLSVTIVNVKVNIYIYIYFIKCDPPQDFDPKSAHDTLPL